jgi:class 3 adenylate cyclase
MTPRPLPVGVVTFLMSDVEGSGRYWSADPHAADEAVRDLDALVATSVEANAGVVLKERGEGDSHFAVFMRPSAAARAACQLQAATAATPPGGLPVRVRIGIHTGEAEPAVDDYYGVAVNQTARLRGVANGGQVVLSGVAATLAAPALRTELRFKSLGHHRVRDFARLVEVVQVSAPGTDDRFPPLRTGETSGPAVLTVVAVDVCGATRHVAGTSAPEVIDWQRRVASGLRKVAEAFEPAVLKLVGDGCLAAFEDPDRALEFLHGVRAAATATSLQVRCGVEVGRVELDDGDVVGPAVFVAAELCRRARPDEILGSVLVAELSGRRSTAVSPRTVTPPATGTTLDVVSL